MEVEAVRSVNWFFFTAKNCFRCLGHGKVMWVSPDLSEHRITCPSCRGLGNDRLLEMQLYVEARERGQK